MIRVNIVVGVFALAASATLSGPAAAAGDERFYGQEKFTIVMEHSGRQTGTTTIHVRDFGRRRVEINETTMSIAGVKQKTSNRVVSEGARVTTIDSKTKSGTYTTNPLYDEIVARMRGRTGAEFGKEIMTRSGGRLTGEKASFDGQACDYWEIASLGSLSCVTPWGATLHIKTNLAGIAVEQTATAVRLGDGGPDEAFAYDKSKVTEGPNIADIMGKLNKN